MTQIDYEVNLYELKQSCFETIVHDWAMDKLYS